LGRDKAVLFTTSYLIEYSLSVDNLFVFLAIFTICGTTGSSAKSFTLGIIGAVIFRGIFIFAGIRLISKISFSYLCPGSFPYLHQYQISKQKEKQVKPEKNPSCVLPENYTYHT